MKIRFWLAAAALAALAAATPASAHVTLDLAEAPADSYVRVAIRVGHGCGGAATVGVRLQVPPGLHSIRPAPKSGWTITLVPGERGAGSAVREIVWRGGPLADLFFDEFLLMFRTPGQPGETLLFPFVQECEGGAVSHWIERTEPGQPQARWPAYPLRLIPKP